MDNITQLLIFISVVNTFTIVYLIYRLYYKDAYIAETNVINSLSRWINIFKKQIPDIISARSPKRKKFANKTYNDTPIEPTNLVNNDQQKKTKRMLRDENRINFMVKLKKDLSDTLATYDINLNIDSIMPVLTDLTDELLEIYFPANIYNSNDSDIKYRST